MGIVNQRSAVVSDGANGRVSTPAQIAGDRGHRLAAAADRRSNASTFTHHCGTPVVGVNADSTVTTPPPLGLGRGPPSTPRSAGTRNVGNPSVINIGLTILWTHLKFLRRAG